MAKMNKVKFDIEYDVKPGTQINIVIVEAPTEDDHDDGPKIGFHADFDSSDQEDLEKEDEEEELGEDGE